MKLGILICSYNRPQYLRQCLESIERADLSQVETIVIIDDASTDPKTHALIDEFEVKGVQVIKVFSKINRSIKGSLLYGFDLLFKDHDVVTNLDGDAIVANNFIEVLLKLHNTFQGDCIVSGFNTTVKNRNPILTEMKTYFLKKYVSGINILVNKNIYEKYVRPSLQKEGNWDFNTSLASEADGKPVVVAKPSVVQHIGIEESSMGHISGSEPPDVATDFIYSYPVDYEKQSERLWNQKLRLNNVTLFGIAYNDPVGLHRAAEISQRDIEFGAVVMITEKLFEGRIGYSDFCLKQLNKYITKTSHCLKIEPDGFVQNALAWDESWLQYDVVAPVWRWYTDKYKIGCGGFSLRSKRLYDILATDPKIVLVNDQYINQYEEDHLIGRVYRDYLEGEYGIKFAPEEVCEKFGIEAWASPDDTYSGQFGFHGYKVKGLPFPPSPKVK